MVKHDPKRLSCFEEITVNQCSSRSRRAILSLFLAALVLTSAAAIVAVAGIEAGGFTGSSPIQYGAVSREYWPTESWQSSTPERQGMNSLYLDNAIAYINDNIYPTDSFIIVRHGYVVCEAYLDGYHYKLCHHLQSAAKSIASILIGIAIDKGFIKNISQKVVDFFPSWRITNLDSLKQNMTLRHLLTMTTGLAWDEWTLPIEDPWNSLGAMYRSANWAQYVLDTPMECQPGQKWVYCSGASFLLGVIIHQVSNYTVESFARKFLFDPIGVGYVRWDTAPGGYYQTQGGLYMTPRDMTRVGYLMLNNGTWDGKEIVSASWVAESTNTSLRQALTNPNVPDSFGYGYQWWTYPSIHCYFASGYGGQHIFVVSRYDLVVIFTADSFHDGPDPSFYILPNFIYPSVMSEGPLPEKTQPNAQPGPDMTGVTVILCVVMVAVAVLLDVCLTLKHARSKRVVKPVRVNRHDRVSRRSRSV